MDNDQRRKRYGRKTAAHLAAHAAKRAKQRHNFGLDAERLIWFNDQIQTGQSIPLETQSNSRTVHAVKRKSRMYVVVYDTKRSCVVTFLPVTAPNVSLMVFRAWEIFAKRQMKKASLRARELGVVYDPRWDDDED